MVATAAVPTAQAAPTDLPRVLSAGLGRVPCDDQAVGGSAGWSAGWSVSWSGFGWLVAPDPSLAMEGSCRDAWANLVEVPLTFA